MSSQIPADEHQTDHDYDGIRELDNPLPRWWLWTFAGTTVFAIAYWLAMHSLPAATTSFDRYGVEHDELERIALANAVDPSVILAQAKDPAAVAAGFTVFSNRCVTCHGDHGQGGVGPNLTDGHWLHGGDTKSIYATVSRGYPKLGMPEWRAVLEDVDVQHLVAWIESVRGTNVVGKAPQGEEYRP